MSSVLSRLGQGIKRGAARVARLLKTDIGKPRAEAGTGVPHRAKRGNALARGRASLVTLFMNPRVRVAITALLVGLVIYNGFLFHFRLQRAEADKSQAEKALASVNAQFSQVQESWEKQPIADAVKNLNSQVNSAEVYFENDASRYATILRLGELLMIELSQEKSGVQVVAFQPPTPGETVTIGSGQYRPTAINHVAEGQLPDIANFLSEVEYAAIETGE
ncbi:MAG: hypothetical protein NTU41_02715, partial [Chloroflexi bacterium]|nr:hypothetical protein [Chloroflexota bacterium]